MGYVLSSLTILALLVLSLGPAGESTVGPRAGVGVIQRMGVDPAVASPANPQRALSWPRGAPRTEIAPEPTPYVFTREDVRRAVLGAAERHGVDANQMLRIVQCESGLNPYAVNKTSLVKGAWQFADRTWAANSERYGHSGESAFDPYAASNVAAQMIRAGNIGAWNASRNCWE